ncbi:type I glyceraldehyde-3-phosphate dehydrogenase [Candidatus Pacearchaeota archaeon]|nr:type I glyceraldehyde-3-phosphate dehydrogenase [Candidatus Pacearchaeota archaeon]
MVKVAINGLGRIGRSVLKIALDKKVDIVAVNDLTSPENLAYLLKYDSVYGVWDKKVESGNGFLLIEGKKIKVFAEKDPSSLPWKSLKIDVVIESTGLFTSREGSEKHLKAGAKHVLISAPCKNDIFTVVPGVNNNLLKKQDIISVASCTTNCLAPVVKILHDSFGIEKGFMTTIHAYTADQRLQDSPHNDLRRGRAAAENLVPTSTGAIIAVTQVIPSLKGKLNGIAIRAPVVCGSITDFVALLSKKVSAEDINNAVRKAANGNMKGIVQYSDDPLVSRDIIGNSHSSIFDSLSTLIIDENSGKGNMIKVIAWYDNEYGYSNRMIDVVKMLRL